MEDVELDNLAIQWRGALAAAEESLDEVSQSRKALQFPATELRELMTELAEQRGAAEIDLEALGRTTHTHLHRHLSGPPASSTLLGLEAGVRACIFDLDGVLTASARLHAAAWQETFDELLARHHEGAHEDFGPWRPFGRRDDYFRYLHGRRRLEGIHEFLASRGIRLSNGSPADPPGAETAFGLANRKNQVLRRRMRYEGVRAYPDSALFLELAHEAKLGCAVVSASTNTEEILRRAGLLFLIDEVVDGDAMAADDLRPKPAPDSVLAACRRLDVNPASAATFETTTAGITAGRAAGVQRIVAVGHGRHAGALAARGADRVVSDLGELVDHTLA